MWRRVDRENSGSNCWNSTEFHNWNSGAKSSKLVLSLAKAQLRSEIVNMVNMVKAKVKKVACRMCSNLFGGGGQHPIEIQ